MKLSMFLLLWHTMFAAVAASTVTAGEEAPQRGAVIPPEHEMELEEGRIQWEKTGKLRRVQADGVFPDDDPYWNPFGVMERKPCIPFDMIREDQINNPNADGDCATNSCGGGCCRAYNWLLCDDDSSFPYVSCVCNENTWPPEQWTKAPTVPVPTTPTPPPTLRPVTAPPTLAPTLAPTVAPVADAATATPTTATAGTAAPTMMMAGTSAPTMMMAGTAVPTTATAGTAVPTAGATNGATMDIVDTAISAGSFNVLTGLLTQVGLVDTLRGEGPFTVFAPPDSAFGTPDEVAAIAALPAETLTSILTYHVVAGEVASTDLTDGMTAPTVEGSSLTFTIAADGSIDVNEADITQADIMATNGIIHVISEVLIPPTVSLRH